MRNLLLLFAFYLLASTAVAQQSPSRSDSIVTSIAPEYDSVSKLHRFFFGNNYRQLWAAPVKMRVLHIETEKGGLVPFERGGGNQTRSLKLKDNQGRVWALRSVQKYPERALPKKLRKTVVKSILQDQVSTSHPYAALTVPVFSHAMGVASTNPEIVYVPDDAALGKYRKDFANSVLLLEENIPTSLPTDKTEDVQDNLESSDHYSVDQLALLRARMLDHLIGDWDRHEGQWRWLPTVKDHDTVYEPLPRDRDKVFYNTSGMLPTLAALEPPHSQLQGFNDYIHLIRYYNFNNRYFDRYFLNRPTRQDWLNEIDFAQKHMTDSVINVALKQLPPNIYALSAKRINGKLRERRNHLRSYMLKYYLDLAKRVDIPATSQDELFDITYQPNGNVLVNIYRVNNGIRGKLLYSRMFEDDITTEVRLYGLGGNDVFRVHANGFSKPHMKVRMIGGDGIDSFFVAPNISNRRRLYVYDRSDEVNYLPPSSKVRLKTSTDSLVNSFDRKNYKFERIGPFFSYEYNADLGNLVTTGFEYKKQGFRKEPFAERHVVAAHYSIQINSWFFNYSGYLTQVFGKKNDVSIDLLARGINNVGNFFGIGNETPLEHFTTNPLDYYRNHFDYYSAEGRLHTKLSKRVSISNGVSSLLYMSGQESNAGKFLHAFEVTRPGEDVYSERLFAGLVSGITLDTRNSNELPYKGMFWRTELTGMKGLIRHHSSYGSGLTEFTFYLPLRDSTIVLANRTGAGTTVGHPLFFQQMQLGGSNLRGFYTHRFTGKSVAYNNTELRIKLFDFVSYLFPGTVGVVAFTDVGRVWAPGEASDKWHHGYGGGIYIVPAEVVLIQAGAAHSVERTLPYVSIGFSF